MAARNPSITKRKSGMGDGVGGTAKSGINNVKGINNPHKTSARVDQGPKGTTMGTRPPTGSFASVMMNQFTQGKGGGVSGKPKGAKSAKNVIPGY